MELRTSSVNITQMQVEKYGNKKPQLLLTWSLFMLTFVIFFYAWGIAEEGCGVYVFLSVSTCVRLLFVTFTAQSISPRCITLDSTLLPFPFPSLPEMMSLHDDGAQIKPSLCCSWELNLVPFYDFFISLLPPLVCVSTRQGTNYWPEARSTGFLPRPRCSVKVSPWPINRKPIVMVVT